MECEVSRLRRRRESPDSSVEQFPEELEIQKN